MYELFDIMFWLVFVIAFGTIILGIVRGISQWNRNNHSPRLTVDARVVAKRIDVTHHNHANAGDPTGAHGSYTTTSTSYYITFEVESGDRIELCVDGREYGMIAEGDTGRLSFQGTRYLGFERG